MANPKENFSEIATAFFMGVAEGLIWKSDPNKDSSKVDEYLHILRKYKSNDNPHSELQNQVNALKEEVQLLKDQLADKDELIALLREKLDQ
ncbi:hypothetical protein AAG747_17625 [Rapidithrix thailandica]|uniref:Uncharacterized protein n=1 Tax=Rapidithrix thailandica TaxID=413964 RepID=A0AAW9SBA4_9BACT